MPNTIKTRFYLYVLTNEGLLLSAYEYVKTYSLCYCTLSDYGYDTKEEALEAALNNNHYNYIVLEKTYTAYEPE